VKDCSITPVIDDEIIEDERALLQKGPLAMRKKRSGKGKLTLSPATYEDICYLADMFFAKATPGGSYTRAWAAATTAINAPRKAAIAYGQSGIIYTLAGAIATQLHIAGETNGLITADVDLVGKDVAAGTQAALSDRTVNPILGNHASLAIDAVGGTIGTTTIATSMFSFDFTATNGRALDFHMGAATPDSYVDGDYAGKLKLSLEINATTLAYLTSLLSGTLQQQIQIKFDDTASRQFVIQVGATLMGDIEMFPEKNGVHTLDLEYEFAYNTTLANSMKMTSLNGVAVLA